MTDISGSSSRPGVKWGGGTAPPHFFRQGGRVPIYWTEIRAKVSPLLQLVTY